MNPSKKTPDIANFRCVVVWSFMIWEGVLATLLIPWRRRRADLWDWQQKDPDIKEQVGYDQAVQKREWDGTILKIGIIPKCRDVRTALEADEKQKCYEPKKNNHCRGLSNEIKLWVKASNTEDTSVEEESTNFDAGKGTCWESIPCYLYLCSSQREKVEWAHGIDTWADSFAMDMTRSVVKLSVA